MKRQTPGWQDKLHCIDQGCPTGGKAKRLCSMLLGGTRPVKAGINTRGMKSSGCRSLEISGTVRET